MSGVRHAEPDAFMSKEKCATPCQGWGQNTCLSVSYFSCCNRWVILRL